MFSRSSLSMLATNSSASFITRLGLRPRVVLRAAFVLVVVLVRRAVTNVLAAFGTQAGAHSNVARLPQIGLALGLHHGADLPAHQLRLKLNAVLLQQVRSG
jgi:hypothetical protein